MDVTFILVFFCGSFCCCGIFFAERAIDGRSPSLDAFSFVIIDSRGGWQLARSEASSSASTCPAARRFQEPFRTAVEWIETG
jgi:hypothetical protein